MHYIFVKVKNGQLREIFDPIRDHYTFAYPDGPLGEYIEFFSESIVNDRVFSVEMFPSWTPTIYVNLGNPYRIGISHFSHSISAETDILVLRDLPTARYNLPGDRIFTIKFRPGGLEAVLGLSQIGLKGTISPLNDVLPFPLLQQLKSNVSFNERNHIVAQYFSGKLKNSVSDHYQTFVRDLTETYEQTHLQLNVSQLAEKHFLTSKSVNRYFLRVIGISPKAYFSILRARTALTAYVTRTDFDPCRFGYYDGSHFYKEMIRFTGNPLNALRS